MIVRKRLATIALTLAALMAATFLPASPAQAVPNTKPCTDTALLNEWFWNMYEWSDTFYGSGDPMTQNYFNAWVASSEYLARNC
jgi:hypothetical protein